MDDGTPGSRGFYGGWIKGRDPHVYYSISLRDDYDQNADRAYVVGEGGDRRGGEVVASLEITAEWIQSGRLRVVSAEDVPPRAVLERIGQEEIKRILRVEVLTRRRGGRPGETRTVWVGSTRFSLGPLLVLDEKGRIVRAGEIIGQALAAYQAEIAAKGF